MNEEALKDAYNLFGNNGYNGSLDEFKNLISTNNEALTDSFTLFTENGYTGSVDEFKELVINDNKKDKISRGVFEEDKNIYIENPQTQHEKDKDKFDNIVQKEKDIAEIGSDESFFNINENIEENLQKELSKVYSKWGFVFEESGIGDYITVSTTDPENVQQKEFSVGKFGKVDEQGIAEMKQWLNDNRTKNAIFLEEIPQINKHDLWEKISLDENIKDLNIEEMEELAEESDLLNDFSRQYFASEGLNWDKWKELEKNQKYNQEELDFIEDKLWSIRTEVTPTFGSTGAAFNKFSVFHSDYKGTKEEIERYPDLFNEDGSLKLDEQGVSQLTKHLENTNEKNADVLTNPIFQKAEDGMKQMLSEIRDEAQVEVVKENESIINEFNTQTEKFETLTGVSWDNREQVLNDYQSKQVILDNQLKEITNGVGFNELKNYQPKSQKELDIINDLIKQSQELYDDENIKAINQIYSNVQGLTIKSTRNNQKANNALLLMNYQDLASFRGEYEEEAYMGLWNETLKSWKQGNTNRAFLNVAFGITDVNDPEQLAKVSQRVALNNAYSQGKLSTRVFERYQNAGSVAEQMELLGQNPLEILTTLFASSMSQFASTGAVTFAPIVGGSTAIGASLGSAGFIAGPTGVATTGGGALLGLEKGLTSWSAITGFAMELGASYSTVMARHGVDMKDADAIAEVLSGKTKKSQIIMDEAFSEGVKRGIPIAAMNLLGGIASKPFVQPLASPTKQILLGATAKTVVDPLFEGLGEGMAQVMSGQGLEMTEVFNEMVGGQFGNQSNVGINLISNTLINSQQKNAMKMMDLNNMVSSDYKLADVRKYVNRLKSKKVITEEQANKIEENAVINDAVNNLIKNKEKSIGDKIKNIFKIGGSPQKQRLASLIEEKQNFPDNKELVADIDAEIDVILETGKIPTDKIELVSDYQNVISKEMQGVNIALKKLGISEDMGIINIDNLEEIENNPEAKKIIEKMMQEENESLAAENQPQYETIQDYLADNFANATHSITPKELGPQFTLFSGKNVMGQMIADRGGKNRTGQKGFRHEALHFILDRVMDSEQVNKIAGELETYIEEESQKPGGAVSKGAYKTIQERLKRYKDKLAKGEYSKEDYNQEVFTTISDAINDKDLIFERQNRGFWQKMADDLRDFFKYTVGLSREEINYDLLNSPEGAFEFLKNYNKAFLGQNKRRFKKIKDVSSTVSDPSLKQRKSLTETPLEAINKLIPSDIKTKEQYDAFIRDNRTAKPIIDALNKQGGVINNYIRSRQTSKAEGDIMIENALFRLFNFNPEEKRADGTIVGPEGFGERIFADTRFASLDARKKLAKQAEKQKVEERIDAEEAKQIATTEPTTPSKTEDKKAKVTPRSKIKKAAPEFVTPELEDKIETAVLEIMEGVKPDVDSKEFKPFIKEVLEGKLTGPVKKKLGIGKDYDFLIKKLGPKLKDIMPVQYFVKLESQTKPEDRIFTKPPVRLTKQADIDAAMRDDKVYVENTKQGVNKYEFKSFSPQKLIDYILAPAISPTTGKRSGLKGTRKTSTAASIATELGQDMMPSIFKGKISPKEHALMSKKIQRNPRMRFSSPGEQIILDSGVSQRKMRTSEMDVSFEDYISDQKFWSKFSEDVGGKNYNFNNPTELKEWKEKEFPKLVKIFPKDFIINSGAFYGYRGFPFRDENPKRNKQGKLQPQHRKAFENYLNENFKDSDYGPPIKNLDIALEKIGQKTKKFDSYFGSKENIKNNKIKDEVLKEIFSRIQNTDDNIIPAAVGMLRTTPAEQAHFMRKIAPVTFRQLGIEGLSSGQITEEHALGASLVAKQALYLASNKVVDDNFTGLQLNYFQGPISKVNDDKVNRKELGMKEGPQKQDLYNVLMGLEDGWLRYAMVSDFNLNDIEILHNGKKIILTKFYGVDVPPGVKITPEIIAKQNSLIVDQIKGRKNKSSARKGMKFSLPVLNDKQKAAIANEKILNNSKVVKLRQSLTNEETIRQAEIMDKALNIARDPNAPVKKIRVFDFDDTLARTKSNVLYTMPDGTKGKLTAEEFAKKGTKMLNEGADFDFSEFNKVIKGKKGPMFKIAEAISDKRGTQDMFVLTARSPEAAPAIKEFLDSLGLNIPIQNITGLGDSSPLAKSGWMVNKAAEGYNDFYFADDHTANVNAVQKVMDVIDVKSKVQQAKMRFSENIDTVFNGIIENKTGILSEKEYSSAKAKTVGANKGKWKFWIAPSAEDFVGLLYPLLGKGALGDTQMAWFKEHLLDPYGRAMENISRTQNRLSNDFKALKKALVKSGGIPKNLNKKAFDNWTYQDIARITAWHTQGFDIPGLSKADLNDILDFVRKNPGIKEFADQLIMINKGDGYAKPGKDWLAGTISTDLLDGLRTNTRSEYLQEWKANKDLIFSEKNLNKLEAAFGSKYREALEDMLRRMETGKNRTSTGNRLENRLLDYINNSVGTVMFLNMRSGVLQTLSAINFLNWNDNNPLKAGIAFANQPQYWKDFMKLMNSDFLIDRRNGLKINVSESEIADAARTSKNKAKAVISYLLKKGFTVTQIMDSFAIASGGATFYRNRIKKYVKQGMSQTEAEAKAFQDFREVAEESQQSARPDRISQQQASALGRVILAFANTPMQYNRIMKKAFLDLKNGRGDAKSHISKIIYYGAIQNAMFTAMQQAMFALLFNEEEEPDEEKRKKYYKMGNSMMDNILRGLGIWGTAASTLVAMTRKVIEESQKEGYPGADYDAAAMELLNFSPPIDIKISKLRQAGSNWKYEGWKHDEAAWSMKDPAYKSAAYVISSLTNVPIDRFYKKMDNIQSALDSDNETWKRIANVLGWANWELESEADRKTRKADEKERKKDIKAKKKEEAQIKKEKEMSAEEKEKLKEEKRRKKYKDLNKAEQVSKLDSLGLSKAEIRALKYEKDRVNKLLELMEE